jgi:5,10-methylenetetrahydrofolate reductase
MSFKQALETKDFVITAEVGPPKGTDVSRMIEHAKGLKGLVDALNVTDNQSAVMRLCPLTASKILIDHGIEPVYQTTCRDRNRLALQSDLLGAAAFGVKNVLALTGDHVSAGDHKDAKPVFDLESVHLLEVIDKLNKGKDMAGNDLRGKTDFYPGAVVTPEAEPLEPQMWKFEKKVAAGAKFFQTQAVYNMNRFEDFMKTASKYNVKILIGVLLLKSAGMAKFLNKFVPGITVPDELIDKLSNSENPGKTGIEIAVQTIKNAKGLCSGAHIMAIGAEEKVPEIISAADIV